MTADKRQVHTDALATLGTIITEKEKRDAIHLAVIPMMAPDSERTLHPGDHVDKTGCTTQYGHRFDNSIGIVDPFIESIVKPGEWFWCLIYPRQITSLRHVWEHPAFPDEPEIEIVTDANTITKDDSMKWMKEYAEQLGYGKDGGEFGQRVYTVEEVLKAAKVWIGRSESTSINGDEHDVPDEFWFHYEIVTGTKVPESKKKQFFNCIC